MHIKFNISLISDTTYNNYTGTKINEIITESGNTIDVIFKPKVLTEDKNLTVHENVATRKVPTVMSKCNSCEWYRKVRKTDCYTCKTKQFELHEFCLAFERGSSEADYFVSLDLENDSCKLVAGTVNSCGPRQDQYVHIGWNRIYPQSILGSYVGDVEDFLAEMPTKHLPHISLLQKLPVKAEKCKTRTYVQPITVGKSECNELPAFNLAWFADDLVSLSDFNNTIN